MENSVLPEGMRDYNDDGYEMICRLKKSIGGDEVQQFLNMKIQHNKEKKLITVSQEPMREGMRFDRDDCPEADNVDEELIYRKQSAKQLK
eukprot:m.287788 g.287788  ORF g.287788 m.287788 type:complete len:90 (+) comp16366_c0_seq2:1316-1585(+)